MTRTKAMLLVMVLLFIVSIPMGFAAQEVTPLYTLVLTAPEGVNNMKYAPADMPGVEFRFVVYRRSFEMGFTNNGNDSIRFLWDQSSYVNFKGNAGAIIVSTDSAEAGGNLVGAGNFQKGMETTTISPMKTQFVRYMIPKDNVRMSVWNAMIPFGSGLKADPLVPADVESLPYKNTRLIVYMEITGKAKPIEFIFTTTKAAVN